MWCIVLLLCVGLVSRAQLSGVYNVPGSYSSIGLAIQDLNTLGVSGAVTVNIAAGHTETVTAGGYALQSIAGASSVNQILIRKNGTGANPLLVAYTGGTSTPSSANQDGIFRFIGTDYVTIDGLDLLDPNTSNPASMEFGYGFFKASTTDGCQHNTIRNCVIMLHRNNSATGSGTSAGGSRGIDMVNALSSAHTTSLAVTAAPGSHSYNQFSGNSILSCFIGIAAVGFVEASPFAFSDQQNSIQNNMIGPATSGTNNVTGGGIFLRGGVNTSLSGNLIRNLSGAGNGITTMSASAISVSGNTLQSFSTSGSGIQVAGATNCTVTMNLIQTFTLTATAVHGINVSTNVNGIAVSQNTVNNLTNTGTTTSAGNVVSGIYMGSSVSNGTVNANVIYTLFNTSTSGYGMRGLVVNTGQATSNLHITNNFVSDVYCYGDAATTYWAIGIALEGSATGGVSVDHNSVHLFRSFAGYNAASCSAALYINSGGGNLNVRNNILANSYNNTTVTTDICYGMYSTVSSGNFTSVDYNNYYVGGTGNVQVMGYLGSAQVSLAGMQTAFGGNLNSKNVLPVFISNTDLHLQSSALNSALDNQGLFLPGVPSDIDNQLRNTSSPDIGADEFSVPSCTIASGGTLALASATACVGQTMTVVSSGVSSGTGTSYLWKVGANPGGPYVPVTGGTGSATPSYTSPPLSAGIYYVILETICAATSMTATSNEGTLTVNAIPTVTASVAAASVCAGQNISLSGSATGGTQYTWSGPHGFTSGIQNPVRANAEPTVSGTYSLSVSDGMCASVASTVFVVVNPYPKTLTLSPTSASICAGGGQLLTALGGVSHPTLNAGTQASVNAVSTTSLGYPAPYSSYYGGQRMQILILASELFAAGFVAGSPITSVQFPVVSMGANWGNSITSNQDFQVNIGHTSLTALTAFQTGLTNVVPVGSFAPSVGYGNIHAFTGPFIWNGASNLVLETTFSNNFAGASGDVIIQHNSPTGFPSTVVYRSDNETAASTATNPAISFTYALRPDFILNGLSVGTTSWGPATGLSATTGHTVTASPTVNTSYTVTASTGACSVSQSVAVNILANPVLTLAATPAAVCAGDAATLTASGAGSYTWTGFPPAGTLVVNPSATTVYTVSARNHTCAAVSETITVTANPLPVITANASPTAVCQGGSAVLSGAGAATYSWVAGPVSSTYVVSPATVSIYTLTGTDNTGCVGQATVDVTVLAPVSVSVSPASPTVCTASALTFTASGASSYTWTSGPLTNTFEVSPLVQTTYTVTGEDSHGCTGQATVAVNTLSLPVVVLSPASASVCASSSVTLTASGAATYSWSSGSSQATETLSPVSSGVYSVTGYSSEGCETTETVAVTVEALPSLSVAPASPTICQNQSLIFSASGAATYSWQPGNVTGASFTASPVGLATAVYTLSGTGGNGCQATKTVAVVVQVCSGLDEQGLLSRHVALYPNPSAGLFTAALDFEGAKEILILNSAGQMLLKASTEDNRLDFDLSDYAKGIYFVHVRSGSSSANFKVLIQ